MKTPISDRRLFVIAASTWLTRIISAGVQVVTVPILLGWLGVARYAAFALVAALVSWTVVAELGAGPELQNRISRARAAGASITTALTPFLPTVLFLLLGWNALALAFAAQLQTWVLTDLTPSLAQTRPIFRLSLPLLACAGVGNIAYRVFYAEQRGWVASIYQGAAALAALVGVLLARRQAPQVDVALCAWLGPPALAGLLAVAQVTWVYRPSIKNAWTETLSLLRAGWRFAVWAIVGNAVLGFDYIVMSKTLVATDIARYNLILKVFQFMWVGYAALLAAFWPLASELIAQRNWSRLTVLVRRNASVGALLTIGGTMLFLVTRPLIVAILSPKLSLDLPLLPILFMGATFVTRVWCDLIATVLMSAGRVGLFLIYLPCQAVIGISAQIALSRRWGLVGVPAGSCLSYLSTAAWILPLAWRALRKEK